MDISAKRDKDFGKGKKNKIDDIFSHILEDRTIYSLKNNLVEP